MLEGMKGKGWDNLEAGLGFGVRAAWMLVSEEVFGNRFGGSGVGGERWAEADLPGGRSECSG